MAKRVGCEVPRIWTPPLRELTPATSKGFEAIAFAEDVLGIRLYPWQKWLLIHALELNPDGTYRFDRVLVLVARQNGKTLVMVLLSLWRMFLDGSQLVIGTAQNLDVAEEAWQNAVDLAQSIDELAAEIPARGGVVRVNGKKTLKLRTGERYKVAAASRRGGRGLTGDLVLLDELREHQSWDAWAAVTNTTVARSLSQIWAFSNAGDVASIVLRTLRRMALWQEGTVGGVEDRLLEEWAQDTDAQALHDALAEFDEDDDDPDLFSDTTAIFEWSAIPGRSKWDRDQWAQANPSLGHGGITEKKLAGFIKLPDHVCRPENLCEWTTSTAESPFGPGVWEKSADETSLIPEGSRVGLCIDVSWDRAYTSIAVAGRAASGLPQAEVPAHRAQTDWVLDWLRDRLNPESEKHQDVFGVTLQTKGAPAMSLHEDVQKVCAEFKVPFVEWAGADLAAGTGEVYDLVQGRTTGAATEEWRQLVVHRNQPILNVAAATARMKKSGDAWVWDRANSPTNIAPLVAWTGALWLLLHHGAERKRSIYETERLVVAGQ